MAETRMTLPELRSELEGVNSEIDNLIEKVEEEGITEEVTEEVVDESRDEEPEEEAPEVEPEEAPKEEERSLEEMVADLESRKADLLEQIEVAEKREERKADLEKGMGEIVEAYEERNEKMATSEVRKSAEYKNAFGEYLKANGDAEKVSAEARALLTENVDGGTIAVPVGVQDKINTAWENDEIMGRIVKTYFKGNLKVGYEASSDGAVIHEEGGEAVTPENLVINYTELVPAMAKKVVEVSDEVLANNSAMVDYLYDEVQYQIVKLIAGNIVTKIGASALTQSYTLAGSAPTTADIVAAAGLLGGEASNPVVITTRAIAAQIKADVLSAHYGYDPFDGMEVIYVDAAALGSNKFIIADLSGVQANFPEGDDAKFKFDDYTKAEEDLVRIIGRLYVGYDVVAKGKTVKAVSA